jgi:hypothetical protein
LTLHQLAEEGTGRNYYRFCVTEAITINIIHIKHYLECGFNKEEEFEFMYTVFDLRTREFVKRCTGYASSEGSDGMVMEALEWTLLSPGDYEYRIYVEDRLVETIPFEIISYADYFKNKLGLE